MKTLLSQSCVKGLITSLTGLAVPSEGSPNLVNVETWKEVCRRRRGIGEYIDTALGGLPMLLGQFFKTDSSSHLVCVTTENFYRYDPTTSAWVLVGAYPGSSGRFAFSTVANDLFIFTDGQNPIKKWNAATYGNLLGSPPVSRYVISFWTHVLLGFTVEGGLACPQRVRWNDTGNPEAWTGGNSGFVDLVDTPDAITGMAPLQDRLFIYKEHSIWEAVYIGYPAMFAFSKIVDGVGLTAPGTLENLGSEHFFLSSDAVYRFDGRGLKEISMPIRDTLFGAHALTNFEAISKSRGMYLEEIEEYWLAVPLGTDTYPHGVFRYHVPSESWWKVQYDKSIHCFGAWALDNPMTWLQEVGTWEAASGIWFETTSAKDAPIPLIGVHDGTHGRIKRVIFDDVSDDASVPEASWETPDYNFGVRTRFVKFWVEARGGTNLELLYSTDEGETWTSLSSKNTTQTWGWLKWNFSLTSELLRFKIKWGVGDTQIRKRAVFYFERAH